MTDQDELRKLRTELVRQAALRYKEYDDAYPDVGMGLNWTHYIKIALLNNGLSEDQVDMEKLK